MGGGRIDFLIWILLGIVGILLFILMVRLFRWIFIRSILRYRIKKLCKRKKFLFVSTHIFWFLGCSKTRCDCYIVTDKNVYSLVLDGVFNRRRNYYYNNDRTRFSEYLFVLIGSMGGLLKMPIRSKKQSVPCCDFWYHFQPEWGGRYRHCTRLICPGGNLFLQEGKTYKSIGNGDALYESTIYSLNGFLRRLEAEE